MPRSHAPLAAGHPAVASSCRVKNAPSRLAFAITAAVPVALVGCVLPHTLSWELGWSNPNLEDRAVAVEASILEGGCAGPVLWVQEVGTGGSSEDPPHLDEGRYGFAARARDLQCRWFAAGCRELDLPVDENDGDVRVVLSETTSEPACADCMAGTCQSTECERDDCSCIAGGCAMHCLENGDCSCLGGNCNMQCEQGASCSCLGGNCGIDCQPGATCTCLGGGCQCQGSGCS